MIYKLPVLWRSGAAARWSRLHTPVETGTPPCRRDKLRSTRSRLRRELATLRCPSSSHRKRCSGLRREPCGEKQTALHLFPAAPRARNAPLSLLFPPQTLRWERCRLQRELHTGVFLGISGRISMEIVTHPGVGMCYNSMTFQVLVNFTISFTGVTLASSR